MLPSSPHVADVYGNVVGAIKKGSLLIDCSTIDPTVSRTLAKQANEAGLLTVDAPVSGGVGGAEAGTLTFMVGGSVAAFDKAKPVLQKMGKNIVHCGDSGNGQVSLKARQKGKEPSYKQANQKRLGRQDLQQHAPGHHHGRHGRDHEPGRAPGHGPQAACVHHQHVVRPQLVVRHKQPGPWRHAQRPRVAWLHRKKKK